jgi:flagellin-specific chaperone FliS
VTKSAAAYARCQDVTLDGERAFEELYARLARWSAEADRARRERDSNTAIARIDRCIALLGYMNLPIDLADNYEVASAILSLHKFAIAALVKAKARPGGTDLAALPGVFVQLAEIFAAIRAGKASGPAAPGT